MPAPLIPIAMALAQFVPSIAKWLGGKNAEDTAQKVVSVAQTVTGLEDPNAAVKRIRESERMAEEFQKTMLGFEVAMLTQVNETMRAEGLSDDPWRRRWRPYWGYVAGTAFGAQIFGTMFIGAWAVIYHPYVASEIIAAIATLTSASMVTWGLAMSVLGVSVLKRSDDKKVAAGQPLGIGLIGALAQRISGKDRQKSHPPIDDM